MVLMYKSFYLDLPILEISKTAMHKFWCDYVKPKYGEKAIMGHMDTESFIMCLKAEDIYTDIAKYIKTRFDTSICKLHRSLPKEKNLKCCGLTHLWSMFPFCSFGFLVFSDGIEWGHWSEMGKEDELG